MLVDGLVQPGHVCAGFGFARTLAGVDWLGRAPHGTDLAPGPGMEDTPPSNVVWFNSGDPINFGELPEAIDTLLQRGVVAYRTDPACADVLFREALAADPSQLPVYYCLYKIHTYRGRLDEALASARAGLAEAARQAGWSADCREWSPQLEPEGPGRFALYTLKALAFIHLRRDEPDEARRLLDILSHVDPSGAVGWPVVAALAEGAAPA
jgi:hypothetical protein